LGGLILVFILALVVLLLITPAIRARRERAIPPPEADPDSPHGVVVHRLDDHRKTRSGADDGQKS
jgi:hypothetical protein